MSSTARFPDVVVVGGGIVGAACAYELARAGARVRLLERGDVARGASWAAGGLLTPVHLAEYPGPLAALCAASLELYPPLVEELRGRSTTDPELRRPGLLILVQDDEDERSVAALEAWKHARGERAERLPAEEARRREPAIAPDVRSALLVPDVLAVRNHRLARALVEAAERLGAAVERGREVTGFLVGRPRGGRRIDGVQTGAGDVRARETVVAAGAWAGALLATIGLDVPVRPMRGQMLLLDGPPGAIRHVVLSRDQYLIPRGDGKVLLGSTVEDAAFDCRVTPEGAAFLLRRLGEFAPGAFDLGLVGSWAGLRPGTPDRLPYIGRPEGVDGLIVAAGHFRNGILLAPVTGRIVADLVLDRPPPVDLAPFRPGRPVLEATS